MNFEVSTQGDVYSFGILILEMLTGKGPTDLMFEGGHNLHKYVKATYPNNLLEIVDNVLLPQLVQSTKPVVREEIGVEKVAMHPNREKTLSSLFGIGLACSVESPRERMNMVGVIRELNQIKNASGIW